MSIQKQLTLKFKERSFEVSYPTVRQHLSIESKKQSLSNQNYGSLIGSMTRDSMHALNLIDALATFSVLIPKFEDMIEVPIGSSYLDISQFDAVELINVYIQSYLPWKRELDKLLDESSFKK